MRKDIDELIEQLKSDDESERRYAAEDLGDTGDLKAIIPLVAALNDPVVAVREAAAEALITIGGSEVAIHMVQLLDSDNTGLRNYAMMILEKLGSETEDTIRSLCKSPSSDLRKFAVDILGKIGEVNQINGIEDIIELLNDKNVNVAAAAAEALGRIGDPATIQILKNYLDGHPWLQCNVIYAILQIGGEEAQKIIDAIDPDKLPQEVVPYYKMAIETLKKRTAKT